MDLTKNKFLTGLFALALVTLSACSSGQVDENGAPLESEGETAQVDASTDAAPVSEDAGLDNPTEVSPDGAVAADPNAPGADTVMATSEEPVNLDTAPAPMTESGPVADAGAPATPIADAPPTANTTTEVPVDTAMVASEPAPVAESTAVASTEPVADPVVDQDDSGVKKKKRKKGHASAESGDGMHYTVRRGDTLMKIAFENYGDLYRWREIYEANRDNISDPNHVPPGTELTLNGAGMVTIERNGEQYLIKGGDTLGTISRDVYGTPRKWKRLWENNRQLIKDPNKIYAGFYLYYQPDGKMTGSGSDGMEGAQAAPAEAPAEQIVQEAQAPAQNMAQAPVQQVAPEAARQPAAAQQPAAPVQAQPGQPAQGQ